MNKWTPKDILGKDITVKIHGAKWYRRLYLWLFPSKRVESDTSFRGMMKRKGSNLSRSQERPKNILLDDKQTQNRHTPK